MSFRTKWNRYAQTPLLRELDSQITRSHRVSLGTLTSTGVLGSSPQKEVISMSNDDGNGNDRPGNLSRERARLLARKIQQRRESAQMVSDLRGGGGGGSKGSRGGGGGAPKVDVEGCDDSNWGNPKPSSQLMALVQGLKSGTMSDAEMALRLQQAIACPIEEPSGTYKDVLGFETSTAPVGTPNLASGKMIVQVDETYTLKRTIFADELTVGIKITEIFIANRCMLTNFSAVPNVGLSAGVFSALNPCPIEWDFPACPAALNIEIDYFNNSGAAIDLLATGYGQAYGCN